MSTTQFHAIDFDFYFVGDFRNVSKFTTRPYARFNIRI